MKNERRADGNQRTPRRRNVSPAGAALAVLVCLIACAGEPPPPATGNGGTPPAGAAAPPDTAAPPATAAPAGYGVEPVAAGGRISGRVVFEGTPPAPRPVAITKDKTVCGASKRTSEALVVGDDGGIRDAVVAIESIARGKAFPAGGRPLLDQRGCWFAPHVQLLPAGAEIDILNNDGILHNLHTFSKRNQAINVAQPRFKKRITQSFELPERVRVVCDVHSWMSAWIVVIGHPYHVLSAPDGSYALAEVPPGDYTLTVWHETLGTQEREVTVEPGETVEAVFTFGS